MVGSGVTVGAPYASNSPSALPASRTGWKILKRLQYIVKTTMATMTTETETETETLKVI